MQQQDSAAPPVPQHLVRILDQVLMGRETPESAQGTLEVSEGELGILLRALIRERAKEQQWEFSD